MTFEAILEPWRSFLRALDARLTEKTSLHCMGGFAVSVLYRMARPTADLDVLSLVPTYQVGQVLEVAGKGSPLHKRYGLYVDYVTVATPPEDYLTRLREVPLGEQIKLRIFALDPYDIALSKLERNLQRDRDDVKFLAQAVPLDLRVLGSRYRRELRPCLANAERTDTTLKLWIEAIKEERSK